MRKSVLFFLILLSFNLLAQSKLTYRSFYNGTEGQDETIVLQCGNILLVTNISEAVQNPIPGFGEEKTYIDYVTGKAYNVVTFSDNESYFTSYPIDNKDIIFKTEGKKKINGYNCTKYTTSINSNRIEVWATTDKPFSATPSSTFGKIKGVIVKYCINGNSTIELKAITKLKKKQWFTLPENLGEEKSPRELNAIIKSKLVIDIPVFEDEQICFTNITKFAGRQLPPDSTIRFSHGTVIAKRVNLPKLPDHYQIFAEITQYSNGDAYDRTASVFVIPEQGSVSFLNAMTDSIQLLPAFTDKKGNTYHGIAFDGDFRPLTELVRFFTPFGIRQFNDRVKIDGLEWENEAVYKQEITDMKGLLTGEVTIGAFIGNYDSGGHKLSLRLLAYPQDYEWTENNDKSWYLPLFNTCNVLEMSGQNYGRFFGTDSLTVSFEIPENIENLKLRYISTGHGGWDGGDEFNQRENSIIIDGEKRFAYTPWRCDCATYREKNPVSGNFWNGTSSSDYSRSGWCPGTATQPTYFDLSFLEAGTHTITIAIPQGHDEGSSFSHWMVSGILLGEIK